MNSGYKCVFIDQSPSLDKNLYNIKENKAVNATLADDVFKKFGNITLILAVTESNIISYTINPEMNDSI